jgi:ASC-1-like (ASCH) protein
MKIYHNYIAEPYFSFLKNGQKTIEGRLQKGWYRGVKPGDQIEVYDGDESELVTTEVLGVRKYPTINEMLNKETLKKMLPDVDTVEDGLAVYRKFYSKEDEKMFGAVAIEVRLIKN